MTTTILTGDCRAILPTLEAGSVQCCVTSPPYFGLRDYGADGQIGLEPTVDAYVAELVAVFREVRRVMADDGTLWLNLGDSYAAGKAGRTDHGSGDPTSRLGPNRDGLPGGTPPGPVVYRKPTNGLKPKDLIGIPWRVAFALQADGWYLRSEIIWHKSNPMPESVTDRPTKAHEQIFLLTKNARYYYDASAIAEPAEYRDYPTWDQRKAGGEPIRRGDPGQSGHVTQWAGLGGDGLTRNKRSVWTVATQPFSDAHFATFPPKLIEPCILAGSREGDTVLDPFGGSGTTAGVANRLGRHSIVIELNPSYVPMIERRTAQQALDLATEGIPA